MPSINWLCALYATLMRIYPAEMRRTFGQEMLMVFREQLRDATARGEKCEMLQVCRYAFTELVTVGIPSRLADSLTLAALGSLSFNSVSFCALLWALHNSKALVTMSRHVCSR